MRDKIKGRRLNWAEVRATRFSRSSRRRHCEIGGISVAKEFFYKNALKILKKIFTKTSQKFENIFKINEK